MKTKQPPKKTTIRRVTFHASEKLHKQIHQAARAAGMRVPAWINKTIQEAV